MELCLVIRLRVLPVVPVLDLEQPDKHFQYNFRQFHFHRFQPAIGDIEYECILKSIKSTSTAALIAIEPSCGAESDPRAD